MLKNSNNFVLYYRELGHLLKPKNDLCEQAQKAMYGVIRKIRHFNLLGNCQINSICLIRLFRQFYCTAVKLEILKI